MKTICFLLLLTAFASAADVTLAWDANTEPDIAKYTVYEKNPVTGVYSAIGTAPVSVNPTFTIPNFTAPLVRTFAVSASNAQGLESELSVALLLRTPGQPKNLRVVKP